VIGPTLGVTMLRPTMIAGIAALAIANQPVMTRFVLSDSSIPEEKPWTRPSAIAARV
jgi:hypothetical protein